MTSFTWAFLVLAVWGISLVATASFFYGLGGRDEARRQVKQLEEEVSP